MDTLSKVERSNRMSRIRSQDTKPELVVRRLLHQLGYRYRLHPHDLPGRPDIVFRSRRKIIFVNGCFWHAHHRCKIASLPKSNTEFWRKKFEKNRERDQKNYQILKRNGWQVKVIWECEIKEVKILSKTLSAFLGPTKHKTNEPTLRA